MVLGKAPATLFDMWIFGFTVPSGEKMVFFLSFNDPSTHLENQLTVHVWVYFSGLNSLSLTLSIFSAKLCSTCLLL